MRSALAVAVGLAVVSPVGATDVTTCYQIVPAHETGTLQTDLTCDGSGGPNVTLQAGARLELNGHTISGGHIGIASDPGPSRVTIEGPGQVTGVAGNTPPFGCAISVQARAVVEHVSLSGNGCGIDTAYGFNLTLNDVQITGNSGDGVTVAPPGPGNGRVRAENVMVSNNGATGIAAWRRVFGRDITVTGNVAGGVLGRTAVTLIDSTTTGNGPDGDIQCPRPPRLRNTTCDHSRDTTSNVPFNVCSLDPSNP